MTWPAGDYDVVHIAFRKMVLSLTHQARIASLCASCSFTVRALQCSVFHRVAWWVESLESLDGFLEESK